MTYSIVARDSGTGEMGVAVQSHFFSVGPVVPWGEAGVGVVATQAMAEPGYGPLGLDLMRGGKTATQTLRALIAADAGESLRQVAMIDANGDVAAHTGSRCIAHAGHRVGDGVSVQANMMERDTVPDAMLAAYTATSGDIVTRMLAALDAAEGEGGDIRGRQSAAMLVVNAAGTGRPWWHDRPLDLRVEDHPEPLAELRRLVGLRRAYTASSVGQNLIGTGDLEAGLAKLDEARALAPDSAEHAFWRGIALSGHDAVEAQRCIASACRQDARWAELLRRLPASGLLPDDPALIAQLLAGV